MNRTFQQSYHIPGALAADVDIRYTAHTNLQLLHVSAVGSNANDATIKIGTSADDDEFLLVSAVGDSGMPVEFELADFVGDQFPRIEDGDVVVVTVDHDGALGTAVQDLTVVLTFAEG